MKWYSIISLYDRYCTVCSSKFTEYAHTFLRVSASILAASDRGFISQLDTRKKQQWRYHYCNHRKNSVQWNFSIAGHMIGDAGVLISGVD